MIWGWLRTVRAVRPPDNCVCNLCISNTGLSDLFAAFPKWESAIRGRYDRPKLQRSRLFVGTRSLQNPEFIFIFLFCYRWLTSTSISFLSSFVGLLFGLPALFWWIFIHYTLLFSLPPCGLSPTCSERCPDCPLSYTGLGRKIKASAILFPPPLWHRRRPFLTPPPAMDR